MIMCLDFNELSRIGKLGDVVAASSAKKHLSTITCIHRILRTFAYQDPRCRPHATFYLRYCARWRCLITSKSPQPRVC